MVCAGARGHLQSDFQASVGPAQTHKPPEDANVHWDGKCFLTVASVIPLVLRYGKSFLISLPFISPPRFFYDESVFFSLSVILLSVCISLCVCLSPLVSVSLCLYFSVSPPPHHRLPSAPTPTPVTSSIKTRAFPYKCNVSSSKWESVYLFQRSRLCSEHFKAFTVNS